MNSGRRDSAGSDRRPSPNRASSHRSTNSRSSETFSLSDIPVADGFRPTPDASNSSTSPSHSTNTPSTTTQPTSEASSKQSPSLRNRPSSVAKPHRPHESLTLRHERAHASPSQPAFARASIASSTGPIIRPESPYRGPTNPSHPYQMYPQRTLSTDTTSTAAPARPDHTAAAITPQGPTHPYSLYTQSTTDVEETPSPPPAIPVGFTATPDNYRRQIGPDGEEAGDLIGPMGHTEELPPYTRYPEVAYIRKTATASEPTSSAASSSAPDEPRPAAVTVAGAGGLGMATRDPEFSSTEEDLGVSHTRHSMRSHHSQISHHDINTAALQVTEKPSRKEKWQGRAKRKLWGIVPYWAICLVLVGMVLMGIIMGAVIGTLLNKADAEEKDDAPPPNEYDYPPTVVEVEPFTTVPDDLVAMATGSFLLPPLEIDRREKSCFNDSMQMGAWSCQIAPRYYSLGVKEVVNATDNFQKYELALQPIDKAYAPLVWGTQPPNVPDPQKLTLVKDTADKEGNGPAWWLKVAYNKTVLIQEGEMSTSTSTKRAIRRGWDLDEFPISEFDSTRFKKDSPWAEEGDKPWLCVWPDTTLEVFLYPNTNATFPPTSTTTTGEAATPTYEDFQSSATSTTPLEPYPRYVKLRERRVSGQGGALGSCRQVIIENGQMKPYPTDGPQAEVIIEEKGEDTSSNGPTIVTKRDTAASEIFKRDKAELTPCGCLWST